jgi:hypothetical protein
MFNNIQYFYSVKFISLFLCLLVFTLTAVPCCALERSDAGVQQMPAKEEQHKCTEKDDDCCKDCSPFYVCGTCVGFTINSYLAPAFIVYFRTVKHESIYLIIELLQNHSVIWQPPQLG